MSIELRITTALTSFGYPIKADTYTGAEKTYFVFNHNTFGTDHGDNKPQHEQALIQVHFYCPVGVNSVTLRKNIKKALFLAGFGYPTMTDASDDTGQHWVFEFEALDGVDLT